MNRFELEPLIRAAGAIADDTDLVVIGSQSILGQHPDAPAELLVSMESDLYPRNKPELAALIDGSIGEGSFFHEEFGYYERGVGPETAVLPEGWQDRLVPIDNENTNGVTGWCLEVNDLAISKYVAGRPKDQDFTLALAVHGLSTQSVLIARCELLEVAEEVSRLVLARISRDFARR